MSFTLTWMSRDLEGQRVQITFSLIREKVTWRIKRARFEGEESFTPYGEDWEDLEDAMARHLARGKIQATDVDLVRRLRPPPGELLWAHGRGQVEDRQEHTHDDTADDNA